MNKEVLNFNKPNKFSLERMKLKQKRDRKYFQNIEIRKLNRRC